MHIPYTIPIDIFKSYSVYFYLKIPLHYALEENRLHFRAFFM